MKKILLYLMLPIVVLFFGCNQGSSSESSPINSEFSHLDKEIENLNSDAAKRTFLEAVFNADQKVLQPPRLGQ